MLHVLYTNLNPDIQFNIQFNDTSSESPYRFLHKSYYIENFP